MKKNLFITLLVFAGFAFTACTNSQEQKSNQNANIAENHFHPKGKVPSEYTLKVFEEAKANLPFSDNRDFEEADKGFIAGPKSKIIMADAGHVAWDLESYDWMEDKEEFNSIHPSLWRQSKLNMRTGLFEVIPGIYQVRNLDLSNITFVKGKTGWIVFDPCVSLEIARTAKELVDENLGDFPVVAVVYSHNHIDHFLRYH